MSIDEILDTDKFLYFSVNQKERIRSLHKELHQDEFNFFMEILGSTPATTIKAIARKYSEIFNQSHNCGMRTEQSILSFFASCQTWATLDRKICLFCQREYHDSEIHDELRFWDGIRKMIEAFPRRNQRKKYENKSGQDPTETGTKRIPTCTATFNKNNAPQLILMMPGIEIELPNGLIRKIFKLQSPI